MRIVGTDKQDVSVVLATYNGGPFLAEQLASLAAQTRLPAELIISDDGSSDDTLPIAEDFRSKAPFPVSIRRNPVRLGYGENFLQAAQQARGEFIAFCDQDDIWYPDKLACALEQIRATGACLHVHAARLIDETGAPLGEFRQAIAMPRVYEPLELAPWGSLLGFSMVFARRLIGLVEPAARGGHTFEFEHPLSHDLWIYFLASSLGRVVADERPLVAYRQHRANQTPHVGPGWSDWLRYAGVPAHPRLRRDQIAAHRARLMGELQASTHEPDVADAARRAAAHWRHIAVCEQARRRFYAPGEAHRLAGCLKLVWRGGYRPFPQGGLGRRLLLKDLLYLGLRRRTIEGWCG
jgi:glycosyltransferase involved in cell wall biosynthesis